MASTLEEGQRSWLAVPEWKRVAEDCVTMVVIVKDSLVGVGEHVQWGEGAASGHGALAAGQSAQPPLGPFPLLGLEHLHLLPVNQHPHPTPFLYHNPAQRL
jgi:hypothetical protein